MLTLKEKGEKCKEFFAALRDELGDTYEVYKAGKPGTSLSTMFHEQGGNMDMYLVPKGTKDQITYHGKPNYSVRLSNHWSWYASLNKCSDPNYIQCHNIDVPKPKKRPSPEAPSPHIMAYQVGLVGKGGHYHCLYGEKYNRETHTWEWVESNAEDVANYLAYMCR